MQTKLIAVKVPAAALAASESQAAKIERSAALLLEAFVLYGLQHPRIVSLVAVCTHVRPIMVCMEYMPRGDLRTFLRKCRPSLQGDFNLRVELQHAYLKCRRWCGCMGARGRSIRRLSVCAVQRYLTGNCVSCRSRVRSHLAPSVLAPAAEINHIVMAIISGRMSSALSFLERKRIIHRDIAARNVLVGEDVTDVKLSDLGAARNVKSREDYTYVATTASTCTPSAHHPRLGSRLSIISACMADFACRATTLLTVTRLQHN